jgi:hypothetical protein
VSIFSPLFSGHHPALYNISQKQSEALQAEKLLPQKQAIKKQSK